MMVLAVLSRMTNDVHFESKRFSYYVDFPFMETGDVFVTFSIVNIISSVHALVLCSTV